jgi:hypothetical protein
MLHFRRSGRKYFFSATFAMKIYKEYNKQCTPRLTVRVLCKCDVGKNKYVLMVATVVAKYKSGCGSACDGVWQNMPLIGVWGQTVGFVLECSQKSDLSRVLERVVTFNLFYKEIYK